VGQRVRIVYCIERPDLAGRETVITEGLSVHHGWGGETWEGYGVALHPMFAPTPNQLEPIIDPGREVISWSAMEGLWVPGGVVA
jgi:hypothetical protein